MHHNKRHHEAPHCFSHYTWCCGLLSTLSLPPVCERNSEMKVSKQQENVFSLGGERIEGPILTVTQFEDKHPATRGRMRRYIMFADNGISAYANLKCGVI